MKVYIVMEHDYDWSIVDSVYTSREEAERYIEDTRRHEFEQTGRKAHRRPTAFAWSIEHGNIRSERQKDGTFRVMPEGDGMPTAWEDVPAETYEEFCHRWGARYDITEADVAPQTTADAVGVLDEAVK